MAEHRQCPQARVMVSSADRHPEWHQPLFSAKTHTSASNLSVLPKTTMLVATILNADNK
jgi:hypothetical protein